MWRPLVSVMTTLYYIVIIFHRWVWYRTLSQHYVCIRSSGIIVNPQATIVPNVVSFAASIAELAHGEKSHTQSLTQRIWWPRNQSACTSEQSCKFSVSAAGKIEWVSKERLMFHWTKNGLLYTVSQKIGHAHCAS